MIGLQFPVGTGAEPAFPEPCRDFTCRETQADVRVLLPQKLEVMRRKVDQDETATRLQHANRFY